MWKRQEDGSVRIEQIDAWHLRTLRSLPALADPGNHDRAKHRLFPPPFAPGEATEEHQHDWEEIVRPELEYLFVGSIQRVTDDLKNVCADKPPAAGRGAGADDILPPQRPRMRPPQAADRVRPRAVRAPRRPVINQAGPGGPEETPARPSRWCLTVPAAHVEDWYRAMNQARLMLSAKYDVHRTDDAHVAEMLLSGRLEVLIQYELLSSLCNWWVNAVMRR